VLSSAVFKPTESEAQSSPLSETIFLFFFGQKLTILQPPKQAPLFGPFLGSFSGTDGEWQGLLNAPMIVSRTITVNSNGRSKSDISTRTLCTLANGGHLVSVPFSKSKNHTHKDNKENFRRRIECAFRWTSLCFQKIGKI
jgi:hypothetical protein